MSLFLKNLPHSFFRAVVSSRPIFNKADSLFSSIAVNAQPKLPVLTVRRTFTNSLGTGTLEDKKRHFFKRYSLLHERLKRTKKTFASSKFVTSITEKVDNPASEEKEWDSKKIIPRYKKEERETSRRDVQAITGTWVSKKCMKFNFSSCTKRRSDPSTKPIKLEDGKQRPKKLLQATKKISSKELVRRVSQDHQARRIEICPEEGDAKGRKTKSVKIASQEKKSAKSKTDEDDKSCKPCTSKKAEKKKKGPVKKSSYKPKKQKKKRASEKEETCPEEKDHDRVLEKAADVSLVLDTYKGPSTSDKDSANLIAKLKRELEECRNMRMREMEKKESGSKTSLKSVCEKDKEPKIEKCKSTPAVKTMKSERHVKKTKSADARIDLDPKYCQKKRKKKDEKKEVKKSSSDTCKKKEDKDEVKSSSDVCKKQKQAKTSSDKHKEEKQSFSICDKPKKKATKDKSAEICMAKGVEKSLDSICKKFEKKKEAKKPKKPETPCSYQAPAAVKKKSKSSGCDRKDKKKAKKSCSGVYEEKKVKKDENICKKYSEPKLKDKTKRAKDDVKEAKKSSSDVCKKKKETKTSSEAQPMKEEKQQSFTICDKPKDNKATKDKSAEVCMAKGVAKSLDSMCKKFDKKKQVKESKLPKGPCNYQAPEEVKKKVKKSSSDMCRKKKEAKTSSEICKKQEVKKSSSGTVAKKEEKKEVKKTTSDVCRKKKEAKTSSSDVQKKEEEKQSFTICDKPKEQKAKDKVVEVCMAKGVENSLEKICKKFEKKKKAKKAKIPKPPCQYQPPTPYKGQKASKTTCSSKLKKKSSKPDVKCSKESVKSGEKKKVGKKKSEMIDVCPDDESAKPDTKKKIEKKKSEIKSKKTSDSKDKCASEKKKEPKEDKSKNVSTDQSPLMQCVSVCRSKQKGDAPQTIKPKSKIEVPKEHKIHKKIAEFNKEASKNKPKMDKAGGDECKEEKTTKISPCEHEEEEDSGKDKKAGVKEESSKCEELRAQQDKDSVQKGDCPKFAFSCKNVQEEKEEQKGEEEGRSTEECPNKTKNDLAEKKSLSTVLCKKNTTEAKKSRSQEKLKKKSDSKIKKAKEENLRSNTFIKVCSSEKQGGNVQHTSASKEKKEDVGNKKNIKSKSKERIEKKKLPTKSVLLRSKTRTKFATSANYGKAGSCQEMKKANLRRSKGSTEVADIQHKKDFKASKGKTKPHRTGSSCMSNENKQKSSQKEGSKEKEDRKEKTFIIRVCPKSDAKGKDKERKIKVIVPCEDEDVKLGIRKSDEKGTNMTDTCKSNEDLEYEDCKEELEVDVEKCEAQTQKSKSNIRKVNLKEELRKSSYINKARSTEESGRKDDIHESTPNKIVICSCEHIKDSVLQKILGSGQKNKHEMTTTNKIVVCRSEELEETTCQSSSGSEHKNKIIVCSYKDIKETVIENIFGSKHKSKHETTTKNTVVVCKSEDVEDSTCLNATESVEKDKDGAATKNKIVVCSYEDIKESVLQKMFGCGQNNTHGRTTNKIVVCRSEDFEDSTCPKISGTEQTNKHESTVTNKIILCSYDDIKESVLQKIFESKNKNKRETTTSNKIVVCTHDDTTREIVACKYEDIKDHFLRKITGSGHKDRHGTTKQIVACRYEDIKDAFLQKITGSSAKKQSGTTVIRCKDGNIKEKNLQKITVCSQEDDDEKFEECETSEDKYKDFAACRYEDIKDAVLIKITGSLKKTTKRETKPCKKNHRPEEVCEESKKEEIKIFKPCEHEIIKPGIRKPPDDDVHKPKSKETNVQKVAEKCKETEKEEIKIFKPCEHEEIKSGIRKPPDDVHKSKSKETNVEKVTEMGKETQKEEIKIFKPCEHEVIKPGIRKPPEEEDDKDAKKQSIQDNLCKKKDEKKAKTVLKRKLEEKKETKKIIVCDSQEKVAHKKRDRVKLNCKELMKKYKDYTNKKEEAEEAKCLSKKPTPAQKQEQDLCKKEKLESKEKKEPCDETTDQATEKLNLIKVCAPEAEIAERVDFDLSKVANTSLILVTCNKLSKNTQENKDHKDQSNIKVCKDPVKPDASLQASELKKESPQDKNKCMPPMRLDAPLPKIPEQKKDVVSGSVSFLSSIYSACFGPSKPKPPKKTISAEEIKKKPSKPALKKICSDVRIKDPSETAKPSNKKSKDDVKPTECDKARKETAQILAIVQKCQKDEEKIKNGGKKTDDVCGVVATSKSNTKPASGKYTQLDRKKSTKAYSEIFPIRTEQQKRDWSSKRQPPKDLKQLVDSQLKKCMKEYEKSKSLPDVSKPKSDKKETTDTKMCAKAENKIQKRLPTQVKPWKRPHAPCEYTEPKFAKKEKNSEQKCNIEEKKTEETDSCTSTESKLKPLVTCKHSAKVMRICKPAKYAAQKKKEMPHLVTCSDKDTCKHAKGSGTCTDHEEAKTKSSSPTPEPKAEKTVKKSRSKDSKLSFLSKEKKAPKGEKKPQMIKPCTDAEDTEEHPRGPTEPTDPNQPDQSPLMKTIALCKLRKQTKIPQAGKAPPRDKKCYAEDQSVKELVKFYESKKPKKEDPCEHVELVQEKVCVKESNGQTVQEKVCLRKKEKEGKASEKIRVCTSESTGKRKSTFEKKIVVCREVEERTKGKTVEKDSEDITKKGEKIRVCTPEVIKKKDKTDGDECEETKDKIKTFVPCQHEEIKPGIRHKNREDEKECEKQQKSVEDKKVCPKFRNPCPDFQEKGSRKEENDQCKRKKEKIKSEGNKIEVCKRDSSKKSKNISSKIIKPCPEKVEVKKEQECDGNKEQKTKNFVPCEHEKIKSGIRKEYDEDQVQKTEHLEKERFDINENICKTKDDQKEETEHRNMFVPCQHEKILPGIRHGSKDADKEDSGEDRCKKEENKKSDKDSKKKDSKEKKGRSTLSDLCLAIALKSATEKETCNKKEDTCEEKEESQQKRKCPKFKFICKPLEEKRPCRQDENYERYGVREDPCEKIKAEEGSRKDSQAVIKLNLIKICLQEDETVGRADFDLSKAANTSLILGTYNKHASSKCSQEEEESTDNVKIDIKMCKKTSHQSVKSNVCLSKIPGQKNTCEELETKEECENKEDSCSSKKDGTMEKVKQDHCEAESEIKDDPCEVETKEDDDGEEDSCSTKNDETSQGIKQDNCKAQQDEKFERFGIRKDPCKKAEVKERKCKDEKDICSKKKNEKAVEVRQEKFERFGVKEDPCNNVKTEKNKEEHTVKDTETKLGAKKDPSKTETTRENTKESVADRTVPQLEEEHLQARSFVHNIGTTEESAVKETKSAEKNDPSKAETTRENIKESITDTIMPKIEEDHLQARSFVHNIGSMKESTVKETKSAAIDASKTETARENTKEGTAGPTMSKLEEDYLQARSIVHNIDTTKQSTVNETKPAAIEDASKTETTTENTKRSLPDTTVPKLEDHLQARSFVHNIGSTKEPAVKETKPAATEYASKAETAKENIKDITVPNLEEEHLQARSFVHNIRATKLTVKHDPSPTKENKKDPHTRKAKDNGCENQKEKENACPATPSKKCAKFKFECPVKNKADETRCKDVKKDSCTKDAPKKKEEKVSFPERKQEPIKDFERFGVKEDPHKKLKEERRKREYNCAPSFPERKPAEATDFKRFGVKEDPRKKIAEKKKEETTKKVQSSCSDLQKHNSRGQYANTEFARFGVREDPCVKAREIERKEQEKRNEETQNKQKKDEECSGQLTDGGKKLCGIYKQYLERKKPKKGEDSDKK